MAEFIGRTDIMLSYDGDLVLDETGDLKLTSGFDWITRELNKRIRTINPEWKRYPTIGANVETFIGRPLTRSVLAEMKKQIEDSVEKWGLQDPGIIEVRLVPVNYDSVAIYIFLIVAGTRTSLNRLIFNFDNGNIQDVVDPGVSPPTLVDETETLSSDIHHASVNKYVQRIYGGK